MCYTIESLELLLDMAGIMRNIVVSKFVSSDNVMQALGVAIFVICTPKTETVAEIIEGEVYGDSYIERRNTDSLRQVG